jgi:hypothetical protein
MTYVPGALKTFPIQQLPLPLNRKPHRLPNLRRTILLVTYLAQQDRKRGDADLYRDAGGDARFRAAELSTNLLLSGNNMNRPQQAARHPRLSLWCRAEATVRTTGRLAGRVWGGGSGFPPFRTRLCVEDTIHEQRCTTTTHGRLTWIWLLERQKALPGCTI